MDWEGIAFVAAVVLAAVAVVGGLVLGYRSEEAGDRRGVLGKLRAVAWGIAYAIGGALGFLWYAGIAVIVVAILAGVTEGLGWTDFGWIDSDDKEESRPLSGGTEAECHPSYSGCLDPDATDYDCAGGSGDGPRYTGTVTVSGSDPFGLDGDGNGTGCE